MTAHGLPWLGPMLLRITLLLLNLNETCYRAARVCSEHAKFHLLSPYVYKTR